MKEKKEFYGFYYARSIFCIAIVAWHTRLIGNVSRVNDFNHFLLKDIVNFHFFLLAVPFFIQLSLYLYVYNRSFDNNYFYKRISYLLKLFMFWVSFALLMHYFKGKDITLFFSSLESFFQMIYYGGYDVYYYIFILIVTTLFTEVMLNIKRFINANEYKIFLFLFFILSLVPILLFPVFNWNYRNPLNFIPYSFSAIFLNQYFDGSTAKWQKNSGLIFILLSAIDWILLPIYNIPDRVGTLPILPDYSRVSLVFGSIFFLLFFLKITKEPGRFVRIISSCSLGIYCLHITIPKIIIFMGKYAGFAEFVEMFTINPNVTNVLPFVFSMSTTLIAVLLLKKISCISRYV